MLNIKFLHSLIFSLFPILFLYSCNIDKINPADIFLPIAVSMGFTLLMLGFTYLLYKKLEKAAIATSFFLYFFYAYGYFVASIAIANDGISFALRKQIPIGWIIMLLAALVILAFYKEIKPVQIRFFNIVSLTFLILTSANILFFAINNYGENQSLLNQVDDENQCISSKSNDIHPDIYYLILDGYARKDVLKEIYDFKNDPFIEFLHNKGFFVAEKSAANYCQTYLSLSSALNFTYLDAISKKYKKSGNVGPLIELIENNRVFRILKSAGYKSISTASGYSGTNLEKTDLHFPANLLDTEFVRVLMDTTFLSALRLKFFNNNSMQIEAHRQRVKQAFSILPQIKQKVGSPFISFSHILCPHPPFVFNPDGSLVEETRYYSLNDGSHWRDEKSKYIKGYKGQIEYINNNITELVEKLLSDEREKIIIIQSDHGPGSGLHWEKPDKTNMKERLGCFYAVYFSDRDYSQLQHVISPVNTFRIIFNKYFKTDYPILENRSYFSTWKKRYNFIEVTKEVY
ncbi:MAG: sulfatase-like hydrolase/transferase [Candidatus Rifleibacteriota bacterium]